MRWFYRYFSSTTAFLQFNLPISYIYIYTLYFFPTNKEEIILISISNILTEIFTKRQNNTIVL